MSGVQVAGVALQNVATVRPIRKHGWLEPVDGGGENIKFGAALWNGQIVDVVAAILTPECRTVGQRRVRDRLAAW